jgi:hypothetical protein
LHSNFLLPLPSLSRIQLVFFFLSNFFLPLKCLHPTHLPLVTYSFVHNFLLDIFSILYNNLSNSHLKIMPTISLYENCPLSKNFWGQDWHLQHMLVVTLEVVLYELHIFSNCGVIWRDSLELQMGKLNANAICWQIFLIVVPSKGTPQNYKRENWKPMPSVGNFRNQGFRLTFSIPSSGNFSNVSAKIFQV